MAMQNRWWNVYGGGGDDNGSTAVVTISGFGPAWIVATPLLRFVNGHSEETFAFAGVSGWITEDPSTGAVSDTERDLSDFNSWPYAVWGPNFVQVTFALRLRNANASAVGSVEIWG
jgi:hypothetical protein